MFGKYFVDTTMNWKLWGFLKKKNIIRSVDKDLLGNMDLK